MPEKKEVCFSTLLYRVLKDCGLLRWGLRRVVKHDLGRDMGPCHLSTPVRVDIERPQELLASGDMTMISLANKVCVAWNFIETSAPRRDRMQFF